MTVEEKNSFFHFSVFSFFLRTHVWKEKKTGNQTNFLFTI